MAALEIDQFTEELTTPEEIEEIRNNLDGYEMTITSNLNLESDLHKDKIECTKNKGHKEFIAAVQFEMHHLPQDWRDLHIYNFVKFNMMYRTVRLSIPVVSSRRPRGAFLYRQRGKRFAHTASGWITNIWKMSEKDGDGFCKCVVCSNSDQPKSEWFMVEIKTARHVIHDETEAREAEVEIGYDSEETKEKVKKLKAIDVSEKRTSFREDSINILCPTHDSEIHENYFEAIQNIPPVIDEKLSSLVVVASHPHGCFKTVTFGFLQNEEGFKTAGGKDFVFLYDAPTCPGSSGAPVWISGKDFRSRAEIFSPHSGHDKGSSTMNKSGVRRFLMNDNEDQDLDPNEDIDLYDKTNNDKKSEDLTITENKNEQEKNYQKTNKVEFENHEDRNSGYKEEVLNSENLTENKNIDIETFPEQFKFVINIEKCLTELTNKYAELANKLFEGVSNKTISLEEKESLKAELNSTGNEMDLVMKKKSQGWKLVESLNIPEVWRKHGGMDAFKSFEEVLKSLGQESNVAYSKSVQAMYKLNDLAEKKKKEEEITNSNKN